MFLYFASNIEKLEPYHPKQKCEMFKKELHTMGVARENIDDWLRSCIETFDTTWENKAIVLRKLTKLASWFGKYGNANKLLSQYHKYLIEINYNLERVKIPMPDINKPTFKGFLVYMFNSFSVDLLGIFSMHEDKVLEKVEFDDVLNFLKNKK